MLYLSQPPTLSLSCHLHLDFKVKKPIPRLHGGRGRRCVIVSELVTRMYYNRYVRVKGQPRGQRSTQAAAHSLQASIIICLVAIKIETSHNDIIMNVPYYGHSYNDVSVC